MLDLKNVVVENLNGHTSVMQRFIKMKTILDQKCAANLRLLATKNNINRTADYHYLVLAVNESTAPVSGIDYIHPVVKPVVDYATAVISKGLLPNGEINFEFVPDNEGDSVAARQATNMVHKLLNQNNDPHFILQHWIQDACLHKNGQMLVAPHREQIVRYVTTSGTADQLAAFEQQAREAGLTVLRQSRRKTSVDMAQVEAESAGIRQSGMTQGFEAAMDDMMMKARSLADTPSEGSIPEIDDVDPAGFMAVGIEAGLEDMATQVQDSIRRNTIYEAKYKLTGYNLNIKFRPIAQHYWMCDPTVIEIQEQPFCGFYKPMSIQEATELYPDINLEEFEKYAQYSNVGSYQAGSLLNNLALHARDSVPINGLPSQGYASQESASRQVTVLTVWNRYDIDGDGELELIELIYSGQYVISAREVEFIPVANMCPKPLAQNFYGMSIAESVIPMQEYMTSGHRAQLQLGLLTATPRLGVKPDRLDWEMLQDGESAIFVLDSKFDPAKDIYPLPPPAGDIAFIDQAMNRMQQDTMAMVGMTQPTDVFNPQVMEPGNSGAKLSLALTPNQIIQDNTIKNCAEGLKDAIWLTWRTLIQYGDDYGVKKLAQEYNPEGKADFIDYLAFDDMNFNERHTIRIELALGMRSEENALQRLQIIKQCQTQLAQEVAAGVASGALTLAAFAKMKKPYEDMLYTLGVKEADTYLPSEQEVMEMIAQAQEAEKNKQPNPDDQKKLAGARLDNVRADQIEAEVNGTTAASQLEGVALLSQHKAKAYGT